MKPSLQILFCERFKCLPAQYGDRALKACLHSHAKLLAPLMLRMNTDFFTQDLKFIHQLGESKDLVEAMGCAADFRDGVHAKGSSWRRSCGLRVSERKAVALAGLLFGRERVSAIADIIDGALPD